MLWITVFVVSFSDSDACVKGRYRMCKRVDMLRGQLPACEHAIELRLLRELKHLDRVFDGWAGAADTRALGAAGDSDDVQIQARRKAPVKAKLLLAVKMAFFQR